MTISFFKQGKAMTIKAVIFDMDGLLIDSEPLWKQAEIDCFNAVGIPVTLEDMLALTGIPAPEIAKAIFQKYNQFPMPTEEMGKKINEYAINLILEQKPLMKGVKETLEKLTALGYKLAIASASPRFLLENITKSCGIFDYFSFISSAAELEYSKPHPMVYLNAAKNLGIEPNECIGVEDSVVGMTAVKAASMKCVVIPDPEFKYNPRFSLADVQLDSLFELNEDVINRLN